ncbi:glycoside hydrolase family 130 protein [Agrococcus sp. HG114]|nr:glycoside hydrolase family 130 protein [Agrococcus sp. HG114]
MTEHDARLSPDPSRVIARLFLPGEGIAATHARAADIIARVRALPPERVQEVARELRERFGERHSELDAVFRGNARAVGAARDDDTPEARDRELVLGACFTAEYAVEGTALCNPSAFPHPDQSGLGPDELRVAVALRQIGEGHVSSLGFAEAVVGGAGGWRFAPRATPLARPSQTDGEWLRDHFEATLEHERSSTELSAAIACRLPDRFTASAFEVAVAALPRTLVAHRDAMPELHAMRVALSSAYRASFGPGTALSQRVLMPAAPGEERGIEDARFVRFTHDDGSVEHRATYTAFDGRSIAPRLITSPDLVTFAIHRLTGPAAENKGMALFPRLVGGHHLAVTRSGGERMSLARSSDGLVWDEQTPLHGPEQPWELIQTGNCGAPIETERGWLLLTHGVGPMRTYSLGALLLDREEPWRVIARSTEPILRADGPRRDGYVPNVVYSCGAVAHRGRLWIPYGIGDARVSVASLPLDELLDSLAAAEAAVARRSA